MTEEEFLQGIQIATEKDIKDIILQANIPSLTEEKIFFGWKQNETLKTIQHKNKYNVFIIKDGRTQLGCSGEYTSTNPPKLRVDMLNNFIVQVANYWSNVNKFFDCDSINETLFYLFQNRPGFYKLTRQFPMHKYTDAEASFNYGFSFQYRKDLIIPQNFNFDKIESIKFDYKIIK